MNTSSASCSSRPRRTLADSASPVCTTAPQRPASITSASSGSRTSSITALPCCARSRASGPPTQPPPITTVCVLPRARRHPKRTRRVHSRPRSRSSEAIPATPSATNASANTRAHTNRPGWTILEASGWPSVSRLTPCTSRSVTHAVPVTDFPGGGGDAHETSSAHHAVSSAAMPSKAVATSSEKVLREAIGKGG